MDANVLVSTAPNAGWRPYFFEMTQKNPLPEVAAATARYEADRTNNRIADIVIASAEWNFTPDKVNDLCAAKSLSLPGWMG